MGLFGHGDDPFWTDPLFDDETFATSGKKARKRRRKGADDVPEEDADEVAISDDPVGDLIDVLKPYRKS